MSEKITCYPLENTFAWSYPYDRDLFYSEEIEHYKRWEKSDRVIWVINVFLFNELWEIIIQSRSHHKKHNANRLDKSVWWHIQWWDSPDYTAIVETVQELQVPSIIVGENDNFHKTYNTLKWYLSTIAILKYIDTKIWTFHKEIEKQMIDIQNKSFIYLWVYGWSIKNADGEAKGTLFYDLDDLIREMKKSPQLFTHDLHVHIKCYEQEMRNFIKIITTN
jgi:hypothetical protein